MSQSWQDGKVLRIDPKRMECEAYEGGGGPSQLPPAGTAALALTKDDNRFALDDRTEAHLPGRPVRRRLNA